jgi:polyisoprenoid-binding protein YceI
VERYRIDPQQSRVWIEAKSSLHPIHSESNGLEGFFDAEILGGGRIDPTVPPRAHLEVTVDLLSSGNALYDKEMKRRVDIRRYPTITGDLTTMKETGRDHRYVVEGDLSFKGTTRRYEDEMTLSFPDDGSLTLEGQHTFDIRDFGMEPPKILMLKVHPDVSVRVKIVAKQES